MLPPPIDEALQRGATILTGNQRAARTLIRSFADDRRAAGIRGWQPPAILPWSAFTAGLWQQLLVEGHEQRLLLNRLQEYTLWQNVIRSDTQTATLQSTASLAELARQAHILLHRYGVRHRLPHYSLNSDQQTFLRWLLAFERLCRNEGYITTATLEAEIAQHVRHLRLAPEYLLHGFDGLTPSQHALLSSLPAVITDPAPVPLNQSRTLATASDPKTELRYIAESIRRRLAEKPDARIAVLVPDLHAHRPNIERVFRDVLAPHLHSINDVSSPPFEFSLGQPMADLPAIGDALDLLGWISAPLPVDRVSSLIRSPFLGGSRAEHLSRAALDAHDLRRQILLEPSLTPHRLLAMVRESNIRNISRLREILQALQQPHLKDRSPSAWVAHFRSVLKAIGWPGDRTLLSADFQLIQKWESLLDQLCSLDFTGRTISLSSALDLLRQAAQQTLFAPESQNAPVQIMGILESAGSTFDSIFFLDASDASWPAPASPHPLLPHILQQWAEMPGAAPAAEFQQSLRIAHRIVQSAPDVTFTYAATDGETPQRPSALLRHLATLDDAPAVLTDVEAQPVALEAIPESELPLLPEQAIHGGVSILKLQAACAFRAFSEHRLASQPLRSSETGLDPTARGNVVHRSLELFWNQVQSQARLRALSLGERDRILEDSIRQAMDEAATAFSTWSAAYLDLQRRRLHHVLSRWLVLEAARRTPFLVSSSEREFPEAQIGPLKIKVRIDRIDELNGGGYALIDYKTGKPKPADWLTDRPEEPQLPLYATLLDPEDVQAVAFATIRAGDEMELRGIEATAGILPKTSKLSTADLTEQVEQWRRILTRLAEDFARGETTVAPRQYPQTCQYCGQRILCRVQPDLLVAISNPEDEDA